MIPKPIQFLLLVPLAMGGVLPRLALAVFVLGLLVLGLWWVRLVLSVVLGD